MKWSRVLGSGKSGKSEMDSEKNNKNFLEKTFSEKLRLKYMATERAVNGGLKKERTQVALKKV